MAIRIKCSNPQCGQILDCEDESAGKVVACSRCGLKLLVPSEEEAQQESMLGDYRIVQRIGKGGMGAVYKAVQTRLDRQVALKVLAKKYTKDSRFLERFEREARAAGALNHPNIVQVYDIGNDRGHHFFAMEYVDGEDLSQRVQREKKIPLDKALEIAFEIAQALQYAHHRSIIHRDIKPENIMIGEDGRVKLADLGLAKSTEEDHNVTQDGTALGTPYYMAPEQAQDARSVDHRADIYALGITMLRILTGKRPYDGETAYSIVLAHASDPLPTGKELGTELPLGVESIIQKMCAKNPDDRYQDYETLLEDLDRVKAGQVPAHAPLISDEGLQTINASLKLQSAATELAPPIKKSKSAMVAAAVVTAAALVAVALFVPRNKAKNQKSGPANTQNISKKSFKRNNSKFRKKENKNAAIGEKKSSKRNEKGPVQEAAMSEMYAYAWEYAQKNPNEFREIISKFDQVKKSGSGSIFGMKATDDSRTWQHKWEDAATVELNKRRGSMEKLLVEHKFGEAGKVWKEFPKSLRLISISKMILIEEARIKTALKVYPDSLLGLARPLLAKKSADLTEEDFQALTDLQIKAENPLEGIHLKSRDDLDRLIQDIERRIKARENWLASNREDARKKLWLSFESSMKGKEFEAASSVIAKNGDLIKDETRIQLALDIQSVQTLFARLDESLPRLKGQTILLDGIRQTVSDVKDKKIYVKQGAVERGWGLDALEGDTLVSITLTKDEELEKAARLNALYAFFYGPKEAISKALEDATGAGEDMSYYVAHYTPPTEIVATGETEKKVPERKALSSRDIEKLKELVALIETVEKQLIENEQEKWNIRIAEVLARAQGEADNWSSIARSYVKNKKSNSADKKKRYKRDKAAYYKKKAGYDDSIFKARRAKRNIYEKYHNNSLRLIRNVKAGKTSDLTRYEIATIITN